MKNLTQHEIGLVSGGYLADYFGKKEVVSWEQARLDQRQWYTIAGMGVQALIAHSMQNGPAKSAVSIAGFAVVSAVCNMISAAL